MKRNTRGERKQIPLHPTAKIVWSPLLIWHWQRWWLFPLQFCTGNGYFQPDLTSLHYLRSHLQFCTVLCSSIWRDEQQHQEQDRQCGATLHQTASPSTAHLLGSCAIPMWWPCFCSWSNLIQYQPRHLAQNLIIQAWVSYWNLWMVITSPFLIPLTTYVSTENQGELTIHPHGRAEVGLISLNLEFDAYHEGSHLLMSLIFLLYLFFLLLARAGQVFSHRHKTTSKRYWCHLLLEFARLAALFASRHSSNSNQYGHWKPIPAWTISAAPVSYAWRLNDTHSFYRDILESFLHNTHWKCVCAQ